MSCNKDDGPSHGNPNPDPDPTAFAENFGSEIQRNFLGKVIDTNQSPIQGVTITIGTKTAQTDANGIFIINDAPVNIRFGYVKAEKPGYLHGSRSVVPSSGTNKVTIMLLEENIVGTTNSGTTETITLTNGASVALQGDYKKEDGTTYTGSVSVIMHHLDPADDDMKDQMPGMLYAANAQNQERMLQTFGMLAVILKGSGGETLNLADGSSAEIKVPLDASLLSTAPSTIPLWHFDETNGYWVEDGQAALVGNSYVGTVTHFSFWNCDIPAEAVNLCLTLTDEDDNYLSNIYVTIQSTVYGTRGGYTNEIGQVCGLVPKNETLNINAYLSYEGNCTDAIYSGEIGPFASDANINIVRADVGATWVTETVTGNFTSCNANPVTEGYVFLTYNGNTVVDAVTDGNFDLSLVRCTTSSNSFVLKAQDYVNLQETDSISYTFTTPITNLGTIAACNTVEEFITYQVDDHPPITYYFYIQGGLDGDYLGFYVYSDNQNNYFEISMTSFNGVGSYTNATSINFYDQNGDATTLETQFQGLVNVSAFGNVDEYVDINFSGNLVNFNSPEIIPISGTLHVKREY